MSRLSTVLNDQVFIGNLIAAEDVNMLRELNISCVLSIGCYCNSYRLSKDGQLAASIANNHLSDSLMTESPDSRSTNFAPKKYVHYADISDTAETPLLHIFPYTNDLIRSCVQNGLKVLVHCVYGQSRSATIIVAYMLSIGYKLTAAMEMLKCLHPDICINPGFLAQLYLVSMVDFSSAEYRLVTYRMSSGDTAVRNVQDEKKSMFEPMAYWNGSKVDSLTSRPQEHGRSKGQGTVGVKRKQSSHDMDSVVGRDAGHGDCELGIICCKGCKTTLAPERDIVSLDLSSEISCFLDEYLDDFWKGYKPAWAYKKQVKSAKKDKRREIQDSGHQSYVNPTLPTERRSSSANSEQDLRLNQSRSAIDESIFVRFDSMDEDDGDDEMGEEDEFRRGDHSHGEIFSNLSCRTSKNNSFGDSSSSEMLEFGRGGEFPSCMSVTSSELDSTSDYNHRQHYEQQHSLKEAGNPPGRGNFIAVPSAFSNSPIIEERSQPPANKDLLGLVPNHLVTVPQDWMMKQMIHMMGESGQGTLWCPGCATVCGYWKQNALQILGEFNLCDAFALQESCIRLKRRTKHKIIL